jgi:polyketide synthase PksN
MYGWKAFEDAGYGPRQLWGSRTGIFVGTANTGYSELVLAQAKTGIEGYSAAGLVPSVGPNRLSYLLNLHGPSEPIETACSSSLVAVHRAVRAIAGGECEMALVGGVNTLLTPASHISFGKAGMLSSDGKCKTFSSRADGYVRGEGVGMVVLKRLSAAERDGDHIYGLIRGSAENHGGRGHSLTAPNPQAQAELIKDAYRSAGVTPGSISYIEAHGTGTALGDPVEINGLKSAFQGLYEERGEAAVAGHCGLGSVKSNIGHLELAAGMAGLIKVLLQLKHKTLVPTLHCEEVNPYIRLEESPFYIVRESRSWQKPVDGEGREWPRRAGISSFGFGGVNAHVVVEEYAGARDVDSETPQRPVMVVLSAKDGERLKEHAAQLRQAIGRLGLSDRDLVAMAYTLQVGREAMDHRLAMTVASIDELGAKLDQFLEGKSAIEGLYRGEVKRNSETLAVFRGDDELREAVDKWIQRGKWSKLLELWVKGLEIEWEQAYGGKKPRRLSLPTYPFAKDRCWIDTAAHKPAPVKAAGAGALHPLLHRNTSELSGQRYTSTFTGEELFLTDHRVRMNGRSLQKVLPGVAYLEMARAAMEQASAAHQKAGVLELHDTVWLEPLLVAEPTSVSITLSVQDGDQVAFEIHSGEPGQQTVHCHGQAVFSHDAAPVRHDLARLRSRMDHGSLDPAELDAVLDRMGLSYGPAHRAITSIRLGEKQLLTELSLPAVVAGNEHEYALHPSLLDSALQAAVALVVDVKRAPGKPVVPFVLETLRVLSACPKEMVAWARYADGSGPGDTVVRLDVDLCDRQGNVCVQLRGFAARMIGDHRQAAHLAALPPLVPAKLPVAKHELSFDDELYEKLVADIASSELSIDEAVAFG